MVGVEEIGTAIADREEEIRQKFEKETMIEREAENRVERLISRDAALIITGVRRCGKSIFAFMLSKGKDCSYVNFEDERMPVVARELNSVMEAVYSLKGETPEIFVFDEIQNVDGWEKFIARLVQNKKIIITGSNARLLSKELATYLTGRHVDFTLFPFSFSEFLKFKNFKPKVHLTKDIAKTKNYLREYLETGGFPLSYKIGKLFLIENYRDIIERDIVQRYKIKYVRVLKDLARYLISNISKEVSYNKLRKVLGVKSVHTIINYAEYLQNAYLIFAVERFSFKLKEQMLAPKKVYCVDTGLANVLGFKTSEKYGCFMENSVAIELFRKKSLDRELEIYYWKDHQQREVDFVIKAGRTVRQLIQVCYNTEDLATKERETASLLRAGEELKCKNLLVITWDYGGEEEVDNRKLKFIPLWRWLLEPNSA